MKWIRERDALIAQTLAFVQSVTGRKDDLLPPDSAAFTFTRETVTVQPVPVEAAPPPAEPAPQPPAIQLTTPRMTGDFRTEMQARIANFRKHQERFEREREEYCAATLTKLRAAIRDPSLRPSAEE
ncbi:hypothetical protein JJB99_15905 [Bradyrhizobium diazoefficiens]|uniref:hypothetical protein n=1 Tax=Bradyrhizobium diazoefficiens TaxID=1355477 RepID=UPI0019097D92|nr:hypothetical protein [Bradyrhizobium diazoefficiens]QQO17508.1 hypothetical protein JJB99_15905 [Bradyrhizobium diazoefficiens]